MSLSTAWMHPQGFLVVAELTAGCGRMWVEAGRLIMKLLFWWSELGQEGRWAELKRRAQGMAGPF